MTQKRQTCSHCYSVVGTLPNGQTIPYYTIVTDRPYTQVFHRCTDTDACNERRKKAELGNHHLR